MNVKTLRLMDEQTGDAGDTGSGAAASKGREIAMDDGRKVSFGEKQKIKKDYGTKEGNVFALIDFDNGKSIEVLLQTGNLVELSGSADEALAKSAKVSLDLMGHGTVQKLGDAAAGADNTDDAYEAVLEVATRLNKGEFNKLREGGGGSAKGASELVLALTEYLGRPKEAVREMLQELSPGDKAALRKVEAVATIIEKLRANKAPSKADAEKAAKATALLEKLKADPAAAG